MERYLKKNLKKAHSGMSIIYCSCVMCTVTEIYSYKRQKKKTYGALLTGLHGL